ncbi:MAG TPA: hypothetical protein ENN29_00335 [Candidatus Hydrogenedentes bacterium]|nr:hypothetical protein [Candidatus Hydrogenedentota bacterium]
MADNIQDLCGTLIGDRYRIIRVLGEGGMGAVYLADDNDLWRQVAIKVLRESLQDTPALARRLEMECTLLAQLGSHPNIVTLLDRQTIDGKTILVMEYVPGEDLAEIIERTFQRTPYQKGGGQSEKALMLTPRNAILIAMQCLKALDYAHSKGVLHRDIKPSNLMVRKDHSGNIIAKLMDFGIAKTLKQSSVDTAFTRLTKTEDRAPGTPAYMAPEQIEPDRFGAIGAATDIYAFGVMFFEMLTGQLPFTGGFTELMHAHTNVRPPSPREVNPVIKPELAHVVIRAMQKSPANRFKTAGEMLAALQTAVGMSATDAMHSSTSAKLAFQTPENRKALRLPSRRVFLLLALAIILAVGYWQNVPGMFFQNEVVTTSGSSHEITLEQARSVCLSLRSAADQTSVHEYARSEWAMAERVMERAEEAQDPSEAIRLFTEAGRLFGSTPGVAYERERKARERAEALENFRRDQTEVQRKEENQRFASATKTVDLGDGVTMEFVWIPPGSFLMGTRGISRASRVGTRGTVPPDETPARTVKLTQGFWMAQYEITQEQWVKMMGANPSRFADNPKRPVEQISWSDCQLFIERLNQTVKDGVFRLPTEAEWEYACRAGASTTFNCGNDLAHLPDYAWYAANSGATTQPVGTKKPNSWGLHDMHGNVAEWVQDWYDPTAYGSGAVTNPFGPDSGVFKVRRGGAWSNHHSRLRSAAREKDLPEQRSDMFGARVILVPN